MYDKEHKAKYYRDNKEKIKAQRLRKALRNQIRIDCYKWLHPCARCGESDPVVLTFHHLDPSTKAYEVAKMPAHGYDWDAIQAEIGKCQSLCANCHLRTHDEERRLRQLAAQPA